MKILFVTNNTYNPFIKELVDTITQKKSEIQIDIGTEQFWKSNEGYDILHLHWPEELFDWKVPSENDIAEFEKMLEYWSSQTKIVWTFHNTLPHNYPESIGRRFYQVVLKHVDLIVHMGNESVKELKNLYEIPAAKAKSHTVIPHGLYTCYPSTITKDEARSFFGIGKNTTVLLAFGRIRNNGEKRLVRKIYRSLKDKDKMMIVPKYRFSFSKFKRALEKMYYKFHKGYLAENKFVNTPLVQYYFKSADIVVVPREKILNSGLLILAFYFKKVVIGPDTGVVGEILKETGNPVFDPRNKASLKKCLNEALDLLKIGKGEDNYKYANANWNWDIVAEKHIREYENLNQ